MLATEMKVEIKLCRALMNTQQSDYVQSLTAYFKTRITTTDFLLNKNRKLKISSCPQHDDPCDMQII